MKPGRPSKKIDMLDRESIHTKLSFNQIKQILTDYQNYQMSSIQGEISLNLMQALEKWLTRKANEGKLPMELIKLMDEDDD